MILEIIGYFLINIFFNINLFWRDLFFDSSKIGAVHGEVLAYEWTIEKLYQTFISGHNPFGISKAMLYPFGFNLGLLDAGYGLIFPLFRPFLSTHQTMSIIITLSLILGKRLSLNLILFCVGNLETIRG